MMYSKLWCIHVLKLQIAVQRIGTEMDIPDSFRINSLFLSPPPTPILFKKETH